MSVEIHLPEGEANSGVIFRCQVDENAAKRVFGNQAECDGSDRRWSGGLYDEARRGWIWPSTPGRSTDQFLDHEEESQQFFAEPRVRGALNRDGWNRFQVTCVKDLITIELNSIQTVRFRPRETPWAEPYPELLRDHGYRSFPLSAVLVPESEPFVNSECSPSTAVGWTTDFTKRFPFGAEVATTWPTPESRAVTVPSTRQMR